jgi:formylglycine-generating enzyme required for sulfatase activity
MNLASAIKYCIKNRPRMFFQGNQPSFSRQPVPQQAITQPEPNLTNTATINCLLCMMFLINLTSCSKRHDWFLGNFELDLKATNSQAAKNASNPRLTKDQAQGYLSVGFLTAMAANNPPRYTHTEHEIIKKNEVISYKVIKESDSEIETLYPDGELCSWVKTQNGIAQRDNVGELMHHFRRLPDESVVPRPVDFKENISPSEAERNQKIFEILSTSNKKNPFRNSLGMHFVPTGSPGLLFSVWETRIKDFQTFVEESGHDAVSKNAYGESAYTLEAGAENKQAGGSWRDPHFPEMQNGDHPVVCVSYLDAEAFCAWLTKKERASGKIPEGAIYRLPSDREWTRACGESEYPWGNTYPPKAGDGNYLGSEGIVGALAAISVELPQSGFQDGVVRTSVVGAFNENRFGIHDMGGNVAEWCSTWYHTKLNDEDAKTAFPELKDDAGGQSYRIIRGSSWGGFVREALRSSFRHSQVPATRDCRLGFRCVLVVAVQL